MKVTATASTAYTKSYTLVDRRDQKSNNKTSDGSVKHETNEMVNQRLRKRLGFGEIREEKEASTVTSLAYEKSLEPEHFYLGKYINIVV